MFDLISLSRQEAYEFQDAIVSVYRQAFLPQPYEKSEFEVESFSNALPVHFKRAGFRLVIARDAKTRQTLGFTYGYDLHPGLWWYDLVYPKLEGEKADFWFKDAYQLVEIAVRPSSQGRGIGGGLHDQLLSKLTYRTALLSTMHRETAAFHLYRKRGWIPLLGNFIFPGVDRRYMIMGKSLVKS